jgi:hypothetical protein
MADPDRVAQARRVLAQLGVTVAELQTAEAVGVAMPTVAEYLPTVIAAAGAGAARTYGNYWARMAALWGERRLDTISATDIAALQHEAVARAVPRRNARGGRHSGEHMIAAARAFFVRAIADGLIAAAASPAPQIAKPRRLPSSRRALTPWEVAGDRCPAATTAASARPGRALALIGVSGPFLAPAAGCSTPIKHQESDKCRQLTPTFGTTSAPLDRLRRRPHMLSQIRP